MKILSSHLNSNCKLTPGFNEIGTQSICVSTALLYWKTELWRPTHWERTVCWVHFNPWKGWHVVMKMMCAAEIQNLMKIWSLQSQKPFKQFSCQPLWVKQRPIPLPLLWSLICSPTDQSALFLVSQVAGCDFGLCYVWYSSPLPLFP